MALHRVLASDGSRIARHRRTGKDKEKGAKVRVTQEERVATATVPAVILPGLGNATGDYDALVRALDERGLTAEVANVARWEWSKNARGLLYADYWRGTLQPRPTLNWYLEKVKQALADAKERSGSDKVAIIAHSAGGWLARVYMEEQGMDDVDRIICLGSPMLSGGATFDQTRGILPYVERYCPGAEEVKFLCAVGRYCKGSEKLERFDRGSFERWSRGIGYKALCGEAEVWGDGITPECVAALDRAESLTLDGVYHSPLGKPKGVPWYGDDEVVDHWVHWLLSD